MSESRFQLAYGPVPSRRLGRSLGINNIPPKVCSYSCAYCQVGRTRRARIDRQPFFAPEEVLRSVRSRVEGARAAGEKMDFLTFVPDGEPTLDANLGRAIALLKPMGIPIGVITNSSLLWRKDVRDELATADWVSIKIDATDEPTWRRINRPHRALRLASVLDGMRRFAGEFEGTLVTETMLVQGMNESPKCLDAIAGHLGRLRPKIAYVSVPTRPPAQTGIRRPDPAALVRACEIFGAQVDRVEYLIGYEGNEFAFTGDLESDLLSITAVHPMRDEAVRELVARAGSSWSVVDRLVARGELTEAHHEGHVFFLRRFKQDREVTP